MSKAFVKEDNDAEEEGEEASGLAIPGGKNYITPQGIKRLRDEMKQILDVDRPEIVRTVSWAASNGDRSENGDYIYGKRKLRELDRRLRFLTKRVEIAEVVDPLQNQGKDIILFGATVTLEDENGGKRKYSIVGVDENDVSRGRISWISPMAKALLQRKKGEVITVKTPKGEEDFEILDVKYVELP